MITRTSLFTGAILTIILMLGTTSCKKCKLSDGDQNTGLIVNDVIIYPNSGYMTEYGGAKHVTGSSSYSDRFEVSFDGGATREPVNYSQYNILSNAMYVSCEASLNRSVTHDTILNVYTYSVTGESCKSCNTERYIENYVLISAIPDGAQIIFEENVISK